MSRIVVLTNGNYHARLILQSLMERRRGDVAGIVLVSGDYFGRTGLKALSAIARVTAFPYLFAKVAQMAALRLAGALWPRAALSVRALAWQRDIPCISVVSVGDPAVREALEQWKGELLVSVSCPQKIPASMVAEFGLCGINIHSSLLPKFAGLAPYYWVLAEGERATGTSVHYLTPKFDDGNILATRSLDIHPEESAFGLFERLCREGNEALCEAVARAERGEVGEKQPRRGRSYRSHPSMASYRSLRKNGHVIMRIRELISMILREVRFR